MKQKAITGLLAVALITSMPLAASAAESFAASNVEEGMVNIEATNYFNTVLPGYSNLDVSTFQASAAGTVSVSINQYVDSYYYYGTPPRTMIMLVDSNYNPLDIKYVDGTFGSVTLSGVQAGQTYKISVWNQTGPAMSLNISGSVIYP